MCRRVNTSDLDEVASAISPRTKLVWFESPTNPRLIISDIRVRYLNHIISSHIPFVFHLSFIAWEPMRMGKKICCNLGQCPRSGTQLLMCYI